MASPASRSASRTTLRLIATPALTAAAIVGSIGGVWTMTSPPASALSAPTAMQAAAAAVAVTPAQVDRIFAAWTDATPGCAVGVSVDGQPALARAYGLADVEHGIRNQPDTIFEAGSVSKQFTAAAILLLAREGKLSLDDPARKYLPELPQHANEGAAPLTIRQMLTHTSGLRDWGSLEDIAGWPRTTRAYTHAHVLDIVSRQRALNFTPGTRWSYSNTGYNLAAIIVSRVSGQSFAEFSRTRLFEPLGMTRTSWRDDFTRVVKGRAIAYDTKADGYHTLMPFENVHGNGGLLTTVGDLLRWNEQFVRPVIGDAALVAQQQEVGRFTDGRAHEYALGLRVARYKGLREISHSGATAGYRSDLIRFPDAHLSVAVLCNVDRGNAVAYAHEVADLYLAGRLTPPARPSAAHVLTMSEAAAVIGLYRSAETGDVLRIVRDERDESDARGAPDARGDVRDVRDERRKRDARDTRDVRDARDAGNVRDERAVRNERGARDERGARGARGERSEQGGSPNADAAVVRLRLRVADGPSLIAQSATTFVTPDGDTFELTAPDRARVTGASFAPRSYERLPAIGQPPAEQLASLAGTYLSDELEMSFRVEVRDGGLVLLRRPDAVLTLEPLFADGFRQPRLGTVIFERDTTGRGSTMRIAQDRVWNLRFTRQSAP